MSEDWRKKIKPSRKDLEVSEIEDPLSEAEQEFLQTENEVSLDTRINDEISGSGSEAEKITILKLRHEWSELREDSEKKNRFYNTVENLTIFWLLFIGSLVVLDSIEIPWNDGFYEFDIESKVLIALVTSTTASVIGLFFIVGRYLFPNHNK